MFSGENKCLYGKNIIVLGCPGSGKSYLSQKLSGVLDCNYVSLDNLYWKKDWIRTNDEDFFKNIEKFIGQKNCIIDGNYHDRYLEERIKACDYIIYINISTFSSIFNILRRTIINFFVKKEKIKINLLFKLLWKVINFKSLILPYMVNTIDKYNKDVRYLSSKNEINKYLDQINYTHNNNKKISVYAYILNKENNKKNILAFKIKELPNLPYRLPGGGVKNNEALFSAIYREVYEESGLAKSDLKFLRKLKTSYYYKEYIDKIVIRHNFLFEIDKKQVDSWSHLVSGDDEDANLNFIYKWINLENLDQIDLELSDCLNINEIPELWN